MPLTAARKKEKEVQQHGVSGKPGGIIAQEPYGDSSIAVRLRMRGQSVVNARDELISEYLIAYEPPLTQVLSLPPSRVRRGGSAGLTELFRVLSDAPGEGL